MPPRVRREPKQAAAPSPLSPQASTAATSVELPLSPEAEVVNSMKSKRTAPSTQALYANKIKHAIAWFKEHRPEVLDDGQQKIKIPIPKGPLLEFFGHLCSRANDRDKLAGPEELEPDSPPPLSSSAIVGYKSAILDLYKDKNDDMEYGTSQDLSKVIDGYEKAINNLKKRGMMKIGEGKRHFTAGGYYMIARKFMEITPTGSGGWNTAYFAWAYFVLMWNLMCRTDSVDTLMLQHIEWQNDALIIEEQGGKADQKGEKKFGKHIYANPYDPFVCPVTALAVLVFCSPFRLPDGRQQLFTGTNSKDRFGHLLHTLVHNFTEEELQRLGCEPGDIGTHSNRKGVGTYALGQVSGPSQITVALRMGHSIGNTKDRYIFASEGADQLCGRTVACLPFSDERFGVLPPHFDNTAAAFLTADFWSEIVPGYANYPGCFKSTFPFLLASLLYHEEWLRDNLSSHHPLWQARVFTAEYNLAELRGKVLLGIGACDKTGLKATGVPPYVAINVKLKELTEKVELLGERLGTLESTLKDSLPADVAKKVADEIRASFHVQEGTPGLLPAGVTKVSQMSRTVSDEVLEKALAALWPRLYSKPTANMARKCELVYSTLYNKLLTSNIPEMAGLVKTRKRKHSEVAAIDGV